MTTSKGETSHVNGRNAATAPATVAGRKRASSIGRRRGRPVSYCSRSGAAGTGSTGTGAGNGPGDGAGTVSMRVILTAPGTRPHFAGRPADGPFQFARR